MIQFHWTIALVLFVLVFLIGSYCGGVLVHLCMHRKQLLISEKELRQFRALAQEAMVEHEVSMLKNK